MEIQKVAAAFVRAKRAFGPALKEKVNPAFRSRYADLAACIAAVDGPLLDNGIALTQETFESETGVTVETVFLHESGELLRGGKLHVPAIKHDPQGYGSALSYARRYSLMAACGIAAEDDDGQAAAQPNIDAIVRTINGAVDLNILKSHYTAAMQMLPKEHHERLTAAKDARKKQLAEGAPA